MTSGLDVTPGYPPMQTWHAHVITHTTMYASMFHSNFYYTETAPTPYFVYGSFTQTYDAYGNPYPPMEEFYSSYDAQPSMQFPDMNQAGLPTLPFESQTTFPTPDAQPYGYESTPAEPLYIGDIPSYMNDSSQEQISIFNNSAAFSDVSDTTVPYVEEGGFYPGILAQAHRSRQPVLIYHIPKTDLCYVYNRFDDTYGEKATYICRGCSMLKRHVQAEVISLCYFTEDPVRAGHICHPKCFSKEMAARKAVTATNRCMGDDSGLGESFTQI
ncbi:hypothetical protein COOONC_20637 [Cooperia oncophora]